MKTNQNRHYVAIKGRYVILTANAITAAAQASAKLKVWHTFEAMPDVCDLFTIDGDYAGAVVSRGTCFTNQELDANGRFLLDPNQREEFEDLLREFVRDERNEYSEKLTGVMHGQLEEAGVELGSDDLNTLAFSILDHDFAIPEERIREHVAANVQAFLREQELA